LKLLEISAGRDRFDRFLKRYFDDHAFKTITTEAFLVYLDTGLIKDDTTLRKKLNIREWVYGPGIPANCPRAPQERFARVDLERDRFLNDEPPLQLATVNWSTHEWLHFLRKMPPALSLNQMRSLDVAFNFTNAGNSEVADLWYIMAVRANYAFAYPAMETFLSTVGRRKFLEPLYGEMMKTQRGSELARQLYSKYRKNYHPLAQESLDALILKK